MLPVSTGTRSWECNRSAGCRPATSSKCASRTSSPGATSPNASQARDARGDAAAVERLRPATRRRRTGGATEAPPKDAAPNGLAASSSRPSIVAAADLSSGARVACSRSDGALSSPTPRDGRAVAWRCRVHGVGKLDAYRAADHHLGRCSAATGRSHCTARDSAGFGHLSHGITPHHPRSRSCARRGLLSFRSPRPAVVGSTRDKAAFLHLHHAHPLVWRRPPPPSPTEVG